MRLRISLTLVTLLAAITVLTVGLGSAAATTPPLPDPQTTNIPYVAWAGEQVKVVKCLDRLDTARALSIGLESIIFRGSYSIEDWSGDPFQKPNFLNAANGNPVGGDVVAQNIDGRVCFAVHVTSQKAGMAVIKLAVRDDFLGLFPGADPWLKHQFLVIFLQSQPAAIAEIPTPGDPGGAGVFNPIPGAGPNGTNAFLPGLVKLNVKGTFPLGNNFASPGSGIDFSGTATHTSTITLPDDWAWLANNFAVDDTIAGSNFPGATPMRWDIHDDQLATENHTLTSICLDKLLGAVDAVDNCLGGSEDGTFSRLVGGTTDTIGPFDPLFPDNTLLTDGKLDSGDAPMPALRLDVSLGAGSVGSLSKADKTDIYIRDATKTPETPHNLYAPFYQAYIPTVNQFFGDGSGVAGSVSNNFTGFLGDGLYDYWDTFQVHTRSGFNACFDVLGNPVPTPSGDDSVAVYTDEHGEAYVQFNPNTGINLTPDPNGRCDFYHPGLLGMATIQARSIYPDQPVQWDHNSKLSGTLTKTVNHLANKTLSCVPKGPNEAFCVETIVDLEGNPVSGASVEFTAQAGQGSQPKIQPDAALVGSFDTRGQEILSWTPDAVRLTTNALGMAGISVVSSTNACINVDAENIGTRNGGAGVFRFTNFNPTAGVACTQPGGTGGTGGTTTTSTTSTTTTTTASHPSGSAPAVVTAAPVAISAPVPTAQATAKAVAPAKVTKVQLVSARVVKTKAGRYLSVRVNSASKVAKLRITLIGSNGKVSRVVLRSVSTNATVRVPNLKLAASVRTVRVALA
jgi:hypothetical protein